MGSNKNLHRTNVELNKDDVEWFYNTYYDGSLSACLQMLLSKFREEVQHTPEHYAELAAKRMKEELG